MATTVTYNGVELHNVTTRQWEQEIVYDASGTDVLFQKFHLRFEGILHVQPTGQSLSWIASGSTGGAGGGLAGAYDGMIRRLGQSRCPLTVTIDGKQVLTVTPEAPANDANVNYDVNNGPKPTKVEVLSIVGGQLMKVAFSIDCAKGLCVDPTNGPGGHAVFNNRWSVDESMDSNWFTTRTIRGRMRITRAFPAHKAKNIVVPGLEVGFRREGIQYVASPDGLEVEYGVIDKQVHTAAPWPATKIDGTFSETTTDGVTFHSRLNVRLEGSPDADKRLMMSQIFKIADVKMKIWTETANQDYIIETASVTEHIGEANIVEAEFAIQHNKDTGTRVQQADLLCDRFGVPLDLPPLNGVPYDSRISRTPEIYGYTPQTGTRDPSVLMLLHCYLQQPCDDQHGIGYTDKHSPSYATPGERVPTKVDGYSSKDPLPPSTGDDYSKETRQAVYTMCRAESRYSYNPLRVQLPVAASGSAMEDTAKFVTLGQGQCSRTISIDFERVGEWPEVPEAKDTYQDGSIRGYLLKHWARPQPPSLSPDGRKKVYRISAFYLYGLNRPPMANENMRVGVLPFTSLTQSDNSLTRATIDSARMAP